METGWQDAIPVWIRISLSLLFTALASLYVYSWKKFKYFKDLGIPGPKPTFLIGHIPWLIRKGIIGTDVELLKNYGKVCGVYNGVLPCMIVADPEMIKEIFVKNFHNFTNRVELVPTVVLQSAVSVAKDDHWKYIRAVLSPTFSSGKLRMMTPLIHGCVDSLVGNITEQTKGNKTAEMKSIFGTFTMDVIASTAFGIEVKAQKQPNDPFVKHAKEAMSFAMTSPLLIFAMVFPCLNWILTLVKYDFIPKRNIEFFESVTKAAISKRRQGGTNYKDFLQLMINTHKGIDVGVDVDVDVDVDDSSDYNKYKVRGLTETEIFANALLFLLAAYDTTANALTFTSYLLAANPDCQEKVIEEIDSSLGMGKPSYDNVFSLQYLDMVFSEVLRLYPPSSRINRTPSETVIINGYKIPIGTDVSVPIFALHRCEEYWPDPERFDPERFTQENKAKRNPYVYLPFGIGPRNCLGMRLAQLEAKMAIVTILQRFRFKTTTETEIPPELEKGIFTRAKNGVFLKLEPRIK